MYVCMYVFIYISIDILIFIYSIYIILTCSMAPRRLCSGTRWSIELEAWRRRRCGCVARAMPPPATRQSSKETVPEKGGTWVSLYKILFHFKTFL